MSLIKSTQKKIARGTTALTRVMALKSYRKLAVNFLILTVNLVIIILYFTLSSATIIIIPEQEELTHQLQIPISAQGATPAGGQGSALGGKETTSGSDQPQTVPGQTAQTEVKYSQTFAISADTDEPAQASGEVTVHNTTASRRQTLVAQTQFASADGVIVRLKKTIEVGPGQTVTAAAYADQPGPSGEVGPGRFEIVKLKSDKDKIYGQVAAKFTGGTVRTKFLTIDVYQKAQTEIEQKLKDLAQEKLRAEYPNAKTEDIAISVNNFTSDAKVGDKNIDKFTLAAAARARLVVYDADAARQIIREDLAKTLPPNKIIARVNDQSFTAQPDPDGTNLNASITAAVMPKLPAAVFEKKDIVGLNRDELKKHFRKITGINDIEVKFSPFWVRSVPNLQDHVEIEIKK